MSKRLLICISLAPILFADWALARDFLNEQTQKRKAEYRVEQQVKNNIVVVKPKPKKVKQVVNPTRDSRRIEASLQPQQTYVLVPVQTSGY